MKILQNRITATSVAWLFLFCISSGVGAVPAIAEVKPDDIVGIWLLQEEGQTVEKVQIYPCDESYCGKIVWLRSQQGTDIPVTDQKNKSAELRGRPLMGLEVLQGYKFDGEQSWRGGKFYAYRKGRTVSPQLTLIDADHLKIQVKILFVKKSFVWQRSSLP